MLASLLRCFQDADNDIKVEKILIIGVNKRIYGTIRGTTVGQLFNFLEFIRNPEGPAQLSY